jgi:hypothetical protein
MALFQASEKQLAEHKAKLFDEVRPHCGGEELEAAALFRRGGFGASYAASKLGGGLPYAAVNMMRKKRSGGMPERIILAVTPSKLYAFSWKPKRSSYQVKDEVAVWDRTAIRCSTEKAGNMTALVVESPGEDEKIRLVGGGVQDDPFSLEVMEKLGATGGAAA